MCLSRFSRLRLSGSDSTLSCRFKKTIFPYTLKYGAFIEEKFCTLQKICRIVNNWNCKNTIITRVFVMSVREWLSFSIKITGTQPMYDTLKNKLKNRNIKYMYLYVAFVHTWERRSCSSDTNFNKENIVVAMMTFCWHV